MNSNHAIATSLALSFLAAPTAQAYDPPDISNLGNSGGPTFAAVPDDTSFGSRLSPAGDFNGDGADDLIVGGQAAAQGKGAAFVVYGRPGIEGFDLRALGTRGMRIDGAAAGDRVAYSVAGAGDLNGDGIDDVAIGAPSVGLVTAPDAPGAAYVIYGQNTADPADVDLAQIAGSAGARGYQVTTSAPAASLGFSVAAAGDLNQDGRADLVVGEPANGPGAAHVIYGRHAADPGDLEVGSLGTAGFTVQGEFARDAVGTSVAGPGDLNGDGVDDLAIASPSEAENPAKPGDPDGTSYVVYGQATADPADVALASLGARGFTLTTEPSLFGGAEPASSSHVGAAGDINGDGRDDLVVSSDDAAPYGSTYVVYGRATSGAATVALGSLGTAGFEISGKSSPMATGAGDLNEDGRDDLAIAAPGAKPTPVSEPVGAAFVVYGEATADPADFDLDQISSTSRTRGFAAYGPGGAGNQAGGAGLRVAGISDLNADGRPDLAVGMPEVRTPSQSDFGRVYVAGIKPSNDDFANAVALSGASATVTGASGFARQETGEPTHGGAGANGVASVWYAWMAPANGPVTFDTCSATTNFDTVIAVYTGDAVGSLTPVTSNNDACGAKSRASFIAAQGVVYRIAVDGFRATGDPAPIPSGRFVLSVRPGETVAPNTVFTRTPEPLTNIVPQSFRFEAREPDNSLTPSARFSCQLDAYAERPCDSGAAEVNEGDGRHTLTVTAADAFGNEDLTPAVYSWTVDTDPPATIIGQKPKRTIKTRKRRVAVKFSFAADEPGAQFRCKLDGGSFASCGSPKTLRVSRGSHTFTVRATDPAGNEGAPASYSFKVVK